MSSTFENIANRAQRNAASKTMSIALSKVSVTKVVWALVALVIALAVGGCSAGMGSEDVDELSAPLCSAASITMSPTSPRPAGTMVTVTANGTTCASGETAQYRFSFLNSAGQGVVFRDFAASNTAVWNTTGLAGGTYSTLVTVRTAPGSAFSTTYSAAYSIGNTCGTITSFTASPTSPRPSGTAVTLTATATCTPSGTAEFRYAYLGPTGAVVFINANFTAAPVVWDTTGLTGAKTLLAYSRAVGNNSVREALAYSTYTLGTASTICTAVSLSPSPAAPQAAGTNVTLTGSATGCTTPEYSFYYRQSGGTTWILIRDFGAASAIWNTTGRVSGNYEVLVRARNVGTSGSGDVNSQITYAIGSTCGTLTFSASPASPQGQGASITLTGAATCSGGASPEYAFYYRLSSGPSNILIRTFGAASVIWDTSPLAAGIYTLTVLARAVGNTSTSESQAVASYTISPRSLVQVSTGFGYHSCGVVNDGTARCWGENPHGELGNGSMSPSSSLPVTVSGLTTITAITAGGSHSCALRVDHTIRCWGDGTLGQLGNGGTSASAVPVVVTGISDATAISAGFNHTCALRTGGTVTCWGYNANGQSGDSTPANFPKVLTPTMAVAGVSGASALAVGGFHSCALVSGTVKCWGDNSKGQLGGGPTPTQTFSAIAVTGLSGVTGVSSGEEHSCAVVGGAVKCWGDNTYGQLGDGTKVQANTPVSVPGVTTAAQVSAGFPFTCVRLASGSVSCWGHNDEGELGNGSALESLTPVSVTGLTTATSLSSGGLQSCVIVSSGGARCWGYNGFGQLGNGTAADAHSPVSVTFP